MLRRCDDGAASGEIMNEDNPPMVLPNGLVYSDNAMVEMARNNNQLIICARTGDKYRSCVFHVASPNGFGSHAVEVSNVVG